MSKISGDQLARQNVVVRDQATPVVDIYMTRDIDNASLVNALAVDDTTARIDTETTPVVGNVLNLKEVTGTAFYQGGILTVTPIGGDIYDVEMDTPFDFAFGAEDGSVLASRDLNVDGSGTPVEFVATPIGLEAGTEWDITRIIFHIQGNNAMDDGKFGDIATLARGIVLRSQNGITKNILNAKTNGDFAERSFDREYVDRPPTAKTSMVVRRTFAGQDKNGVVLRVRTDEGDGVKCIIQDDLTTVDRLHIIVQGHIFEV